MYNADYVLRIRNYAYIWYFYSPDSPTRNPRNRLKIPLSPGNGNLPFPDPPIPRGSFPVGELASLPALVYFDLTDYMHLDHDIKPLIDFHQTTNIFITK